MKHLLVIWLSLTCLSSGKPGGTKQSGTTTEQKAYAAAKAQVEADLAKRQARSVGLAYGSPDARAAYIEITPEKTTAGTFFCALGFHKTYVGLRDLGKEGKVVVFSAWELGMATAENEVVAIEKGEDVTEQRLGGDDTVQQARLEFPWVAGKPVRMFLQAKAVSDATEFTAHVFDSRRGKWRLIATFLAPGGAIPLQQGYSFLEDFRRDYHSNRAVRRGCWENGWVLTTDGEWQPLLEAQFIGDRNPSLTIDAGATAKGFFLQTGGSTSGKGAKLMDRMKREASGALPDELRKLLRP